MIKLGVNIDHVATVRQARLMRYPDLIQAALEAETGGADSITMHLREDRRHVQDADIFAVQEEITTHLNLELAATPEMVEIACRLRPRACCIVPERREELTTEGGLDALSYIETLQPMCRQLSAAGIEVSLFIDPDVPQIEAACEVGAPTIELHTGQYAEADDPVTQTERLTVIREAAAHADKLGLRVNAGHGLHYDNVTGIAEIETIDELNIGHSIVARALFCGIHTAVAEMRALMYEARP